MNLRKKEKMKKIILTIAMIFCIVLMGCDHRRNRDVGPWSEAQIERMEMREIESVPIYIAEF